jgi:hypothetical protein
MHTDYSPGVLLVIGAVVFGGHITFRSSLMEK